MADRIHQPHADRTHLQQIIAGLQEGVILINPDQTIAWANSAALAMHGVDAIEELGSTVGEFQSRFALHYRNRHPLPPGEAPMDRLVAGEAFSAVVIEVARHAPGEQRRWVHQVRGLVLTDPRGEPDCLVLVLEDQTGQVSAEQRFESMFAANPAPAIIARLSDLRYVKVNQGFLELSGYPREALLGRSMHEIDVLEGASKRNLAIERLHAGATIPQMEAGLKTADGRARTVIVAGHPIEIGDASCMLFSFADLHPRQQAEDALRQSEARFAAAFRMAPGPMAIIARDGLRLLDVNDAFTTATGWRREEVIGRVEPEIGLWGTTEARDELARLMRQTGHARSLEVPLRGKGGQGGDYLLSAEAVTIGGQPCMLVVMLDITERKHTEHELVTAIEAVMQETSWFGQKIVEKLAGLTRDEPAAKPATGSEHLTPRAREVLALMAQGLSDSEIGIELGVSRHTIRNHVSAIYQGIGLHRRSAVVVWARERGLGVSKKSRSHQPRGKRPRKT